ncbi:uroporphyrinogen-III synthase [Gammaproteobacteria bacterium]|nr:uroporphyrinogen-III synthase [Gammaproteobacteria bacterium]
MLPLMLEGKSIWITRPAGQAESLVKSLEESGARPSLLPMLAISPIALNENIKATLLSLDQYDLLFFISTNAASLGMELIHNYWPQFPDQLAIYSVGPTTARVIESYGLKAEYPVERMSSEGLLALASLAQLEGKKALIVRGAGGRELLATALREQGALVDYLELYQRTMLEYGHGHLANSLYNEPPAAVIVTSAEALANFSALLRRDNVNAESVPLFVSSPRIAENAAELGFVQTITMSGADDRAIIESLETHLH